MAAVYAQHRAAINRTTTLALQREQQSEQAANKFVSSRTVTLLALFLGILALAALLGLLIARAITRSIERIRDQANDAATAELPDLVLRIDSLREGEELPTLPPITVPSHDELAELAEALTTMQNTAVRLAAEQAMVRRNVSDVFVSLGRRNQGLLTRQLSFITDLEREQTDDETLADLFRLDHLATRMRRNAESLLVLAGAEPSRKVQQPMPVGDVVRAALSEIEDYSRVDFGAIEPTSLKGNVATDAAHMLAELLENAASFSPPDAVDRGGRERVARGLPAHDHRPRHGHGLRDAARSQSPHLEGDPPRPCTVEGARVVRRGPVGDPPRHRRVPERDAERRRHRQGDGAGAAPAGPDGRRTDPRRGHS